MGKLMLNRNRYSVKFGKKVDKSGSGPIAHYIYDNVRNLFVDLNLKPLKHKVVFTFDKTNIDTPFVKEEYSRIVNPANKEFKAYELNLKNFINE